MIQVKTNKTKSEHDHRLELTTKEVRNYVFPRFKYFTNGTKFKKVRWTGKNGLTLHYKRFEDGTVKVGFEENGYGVATDYYTLNQLEELMLPF